MKGFLGIFACLLSVTAAADYVVEYRHNGTTTSIDQIQATAASWGVQGQAGELVEARVRACDNGINCSSYTAWESYTLLAQAMGEADLGVTMTVDATTEAEAQAACDNAMTDAKPGTGSCDYTVKEITTKTGNVTK